MKDYPLIHAVFVDYFEPITAMMFSAVFVWSILSLKEQTVKYQITRYGFAFICTVLCMFIG